MFRGLLLYLKSEINRKNVLKRFWCHLTFCLLLLSPIWGFSQEIKLNGHFSADTLKVGEAVFYSFSVQYPRKMMVLLPDTTFNFAPFELIEKTYFPTRSDSLYSTDSVVYTLATFELDRVQKLRMPVYLVQGSDSSSLFSDPDSVVIQEMIAVLTDSATYVENTAYTEVPKEVNYPYIIAGSLLGFMILVALAFVFSKPVRRQYKIYKLKKQYRKYKNAYQQALESYKAREENMPPEALLGIWKRYMEQLEKVPYTKLTTKEIAFRRSNGTNLTPILRPIDRGIYGRKVDHQIIESFQELHNVATESYIKSVKEVQNA